MRLTIPRSPTTAICLTQSSTLVRRVCSPRADDKDEDRSDQKEKPDQSDRPIRDPKPSSDPHHPRDCGDDSATHKKEHPQSASMAGAKDPNPRDPGGKKGKSAMKYENSKDPNPRDPGGRRGRNGLQFGALRDPNPRDPGGRKGKNVLQCGGPPQPRDPGGDGGKKGGGRGKTLQNGRQDPHPPREPPNGRALTADLF